MDNRSSSISAMPLSSPEKLRLAVARQSGFCLAIIWIVVCLFVTIFAQAIAPFEPTMISLQARLQPPLLFGGTWQHVMGTDDLGRDLYSRLLYSIQISVSVGIGATCIGAIFGTLVGFLAAEIGGLVDDFVMLLVDAQAALPFMIVALLVMTVFGNSILLFVCLIGLHGWEKYARLARGIALVTRTRGHVIAARTYNASVWRIYIKHVFPTCIPTLLVGATLALPETMILESTLSFLGLGIQPPTSSLGNMLGFGREYLLDAWWIAVTPGFALALTALSVSVVGDFVRRKLAHHV